MSLESNQNPWGAMGKRSAASEPVKSDNPGGAAAAAKAFEQEKRRNPRFKCEGNMELKTEGSTIRTWATFTDLSATGCYVEMMTTFPVGTKMDLQLGMNGFLVNGRAIVRATYPFLGMGIEFTDLSQNAQEQLNSMVLSLNRLVVRRAEDEAKKSIALPPITEPNAIIDALVKYFEIKSSLSANDFVNLVTDSQQRST